MEGSRKFFWPSYREKECRKGLAAGIEQRNQLADLNYQIRKDPAQGCSDCSSLGTNARSPRLREDEVEKMKENLLKHHPFLERRLVLLRSSLSTES
ncbi:hypothetical protein Tco_0662987 [Tanacetum coccineum]